mgnify:FL=1|tara:strand:- start:5 stop:316 length:312 start_codon:yes stop_codon:yes gene_type:complete
MEEKEKTMARKFTLSKYECWWEDATSHAEWKSRSDVGKDTLSICYTEGYLVYKDEDKHIFVMSFTIEDVGDEIIIPTRNIKVINKIGAKTFTEKDFDYGTYKN